MRLSDWFFAMRRSHVENAESPRKSWAERYSVRNTSLRDVLGLRAIPEEAQAEREDAILVAHDERLEGLLVAVGDAAAELALVGIGEDGEAGGALGV
jgi:hypothetical protein